MINLVILVNIYIIQAVSVEKKLIDPFLGECTKNINETKLVNITVKKKNNDRCLSCVVYKVLFGIFFVIGCGTVIYIVYHVYVNRIKYDLPY